MNDEQFKLKQIEILTTLHGEVKRMKDKLHSEAKETNKKLDKIDDFFRNGQFRQQLDESVGNKLKNIASSNSKLTLLLYFAIGIIGTCVGIIFKLIYFAS